MSSTYWNSQLVSVPSGLTCVSSSAVVCVMFEADSESIVAASSVVNVVSAPVTVPRLFDTTTWKW